jgi:DUF438 domain-containing protein
VGKKRNGALSDIGDEQQRLLKNLRSEVRDAQDLLKLLAASQDSETVNADQMEFLGIVGARTLSGEELELAKKGISIDELRKICGRKIEASQRNNCLRDCLPYGHLLRIVYAEHDLVLYFLSDLLSIVMSLYRAIGWMAAKKDTDKIVHIMRHLCKMDAHQVREEQIIGPQLAVQGCADLPKRIFGEHKRLHKQRVELKKLVDSIEQMDFEKWLAAFGEAVQGFVPAVREHIYKEEHILYPESLKVMPAQRVWDDMKNACDEIGLCCF